MNPNPDVSPFGAWPSPISAETLVSGAIGISETCVDSDDIWWAESRPDEGGRTAVMRSQDGEIEEITPADAYVRTLVHEYGGGAWWVHAGTLFYVDVSDQRLRKLTPGSEPVFLTAESEIERGLRYADGRVTPDGQWYICVQERHETGAEPVNELVAIATDGSQRVEVVWGGADFVSSPRISPDGSLVAWLSWNHPNMPWDATVLHVHHLDGASLGDEVVVLGNGAEAWVEPGWTPDGRLFACSDRDDWWNLYEIDLASGALAPIISGPFEIPTPSWVFGMQRWALTDAGMAAVAGLDTGDELILDGRTIALTDTSISSMQPAPGGVVYAGIDTDRHKYPIGSGRVTFSNTKSYMKAVAAAFIEIKTRVSVGTVSERRAAARTASHPRVRQKIFYIDLGLTRDVKRFHILVPTLANRFQIVAIASMGQQGLVMLTETTAHAIQFVVLVHVLVTPASRGASQHCWQTILLVFFQIYLRTFLANTEGDLLCSFFSHPPHHHQMTSPPPRSNWRLLPPLLLPPPRPKLSLILDSFVLGLCSLSST